MRGRYALESLLQRLKSGFFPVRAQNFGRGMRNIPRKILTFVKIWISMAGELQQAIDRVNAKTQIVLDRYAIMQQRLVDSAARIAELEKQLAAAREEAHRLSLEVEFLKVATTISPTREDVAKTRAMLSELVREIDKCITELND